MEVSGVVFRQFPSLPGAGIDAHSHHSSPKPSFACAGARFPVEIRKLSLQDSRVSLKPRNILRLSGSGFCDYGHLRYYNGPRCGGGKMEKVKEKEVKKLKKKLKLLKGLKKDLSMFSEMGFGLDPDQGLADQVKGKMISEATDLLFAQLQQLKAEEKELKRKRKEEKAKTKAARIQNIPNCEVSDSSSDSSNSECEQEVIDMSRLKTEATTLPINDVLQPLIQEPEPTHSVNSVAQLVQGGNLTEVSSSSVNSCSGSCTGTRACNVAVVGCTSGNELSTSASTRKIEVCMGGKCKKSGAAALMEEFQSLVGGEGSVVGCKCMGKCRSGPNVRVLNNGLEAEGVDGSVRAPANPLCIGVGLDDVGLIVANFLGGNCKDLGLVVAS